MSSDVAEENSKLEQLSWQNLTSQVKEALTGRLSGLWGASSDEAAFNSWPIDKQQAMVLVASRLETKGLWELIRKIDNVYGEGGVGIGFSAWPLIVTTLKDRKDFSRFMANHKGASGGFYERGRANAVLHFIYENGTPQKWYVHFDLYSPVYSPVSAFKHWRYEFLGKLTPDWRMIKECLQADS